MKVCIVIVTYNRLETLERTLAAIGLQSEVPAYIFVVNNGSIPEVKEFLDAFSLFKIFPVHLPTNLGFGYGLSAGMKYALTQFNDINYFLLMDDDSYPGKDFIRNLLNARRVINKPGIVCSMGFVDYIWKGPVEIFRDKNRNKRLLSTQPVIYKADHVLVDGALIDREVVDRIGTLREDVFMMCEDAEYSKRISKAGYSISVLEDPALLARLHMGGGDRFSFSTRWRGYYHARNHLMILKEYFTLKALLIYVIRQTKYLVAAVLAPDRFERIRLRVLGIVHGLVGKMGKTIDPEVYKNQ